MAEFDVEEMRRIAWDEINYSEMACRSHIGAACDEIDRLRAEWAQAKADARGIHYWQEEVGRLRAREDDRESLAERGEVLHERIEGLEARIAQYKNLENMEDAEQRQAGMLLTIGYQAEENDRLRARLKIYVEHFAHCGDCANCLEECGHLASEGEL